MPVAEHVETGAVPGIVAFSLSDTGVLAYGVGNAADTAFSLAWVDRRGQEIAEVGPPGWYRGVELSPDGSRIAAHRHDGDGGDIWVMDQARGTTARFTFDASQDNSSPAWSRDGGRIAYASLRAGKWCLYVKPSNGAGDEERVYESGGGDVLAIEPLSWAPDGRSLLFAVFNRTTLWDVWLLSLAEGPKAEPLLQEPTVERHGQISPDGKWLAYMSRETGTNEIYVRGLPPVAGKWAVSTGGGTVPRWRGDGRELFYLAGGKLMAVDVSAEGIAFETGTPDGALRVRPQQRHPRGLFPVRSDQGRPEVPGDSRTAEQCWRCQADPGGRGAQLVRGTAIQGGRTMSLPTGLGPYERAQCTVRVFLSM